jgi:hypothetical protein
MGGEEKMNHFSTSSQNLGEVICTFCFPLSCRRGLWFDTLCYRRTASSTRKRKYNQISQKNERIPAASKISSLFFILLSLSFLLPLHSILSDPAGSPTKINYNGNIRTRGFLLGKDFLTERQTPTTPYNRETFIEEESIKVLNKVNDEIQARIKGEPSTVTPSKEKLNFYDAWILMNIDYMISENLDALWGFRAGNIVLGGRPQSRTNLDAPLVMGPGSGGQMGLGETAGVNVQTTFLYMNFKVPSYLMSFRLGIQLFTSVRGRVIYTRGGGASFNKDYTKYKMSLQGGWIRSKERTFVDRDANSYADKYYMSTNVYFLKLKNDYLGWYKNEIYTYYYQDTDYTDANREHGYLGWVGFFNEFTLQKYNLVLHGIYNYGKLRTARAINDDKGKLVFTAMDRHYIKGGLADVELSYRIDNNTTVGFLGMAATGRPGNEQDGVSSSLRGNGFKSLYPGFTISNMAIDWIGGYALFATGSFNAPLTGMIEAGTYLNFLLFEKLQTTVGYYRLYSFKSPHIENNRYFNEANFRRTSNYFGQEVNLNFRLPVFSGFQLTFRSGYLIPGDGYRAYIDSLYGSYIKEAFLSADSFF